MSYSINLNGLSEAAQELIRLTKLGTGDEIGIQSVLADHPELISGLDEFTKAAKQVGQRIQEQGEKSLVSHPMLTNK